MTLKLIPFPFPLLKLIFVIHSSLKRFHQTSLRIIFQTFIHLDFRGGWFPLIIFKFLSFTICCFILIRSVMITVIFSSFRYYLSDLSVRRSGLLSFRHHRPTGWLTIMSHYGLIFRGILLGFHPQPPRVLTITHPSAGPRCDLHVSGPRRLVSVTCGRRPVRATAERDACRTSSCCHP